MVPCKSNLTQKCLNFVQKKSLMLLIAMSICTRHPDQIDPRIYNCKIVRMDSIFLTVNFLLSLGSQDRSFHCELYVVVISALMLTDSLHVQTVSVSPGHLVKRYRARVL